MTPTCDHGLSRSWKVDVCEEKKKMSVPTPSIILLVMVSERQTSWSQTTVKNKYVEYYEYGNVIRLIVRARSCSSQHTRAILHAQRLQLIVV